MRKIFLTSTCFVIAALLLLVSGLSFFGQRASFGAAEPTISLAQPGLVFRDPLTAAQSQSQLQSNGSWSFGGHYDSDYINYVGQNWQYAANGTKYNAGVAFSESGSGLSISVKAVKAGAYTGFYAISPPSDAELFHARITTTYSSIPGGFL